MRTCKMAGDGPVGEAPRILCSYCKKPAVTKVVKCRNCSNTLHRSCGEKKHLEIGVDNTTICCEAIQTQPPRDKKMADAVCSGFESHNSEEIDEARTVTDVIHEELKPDDTASRGGRLLCVNTGLPNAGYEGENLEVLRLENEYLRRILLEKENTIRDKCSMLLDKDYIINLLNCAIDRCRCNERAKSSRLLSPNSSSSAGGLHDERSAGTGQSRICDGQPRIK